MSIRLRKDEKEALVAALESDYDSPEAAAGAIFALAYDLISKRDQVALYVQWGSGVVIGPFPGQVEAKKAGRLARSTFAVDAPEGAVRVIPLASPASLPTQRTGPPGGTPGCACGHPPLAHLNQRWKRFKQGVKNYDKQPWQPPGCMVEGCTCRETGK